MHFWIKQHFSVQQLSLGETLKPKTTWLNVDRRWSIGRPRRSGHSARARAGDSKRGPLIEDPTVHVWTESALKRPTRETKGGTWAVDLPMDGSRQLNQNENEAQLTTRPARDRRRSPANRRWHGPRQRERKPPTGAQYSNEPPGTTHGARGRLERRRDGGERRRSYG